MRLPQPEHFETYRTTWQPYEPNPKGVLRLPDGADPVPVTVLGVYSRGGVPWEFLVLSEGKPGPVHVPVADVEVAP